MSDHLEQHITPLQTIQRESRRLPIDPLQATPDATTGNHRFEDVELGGSGNSRFYRENGDDVDRTSDEVGRYEEEQQQVRQVPLSRYERSSVG